MQINWKKLFDWTINSVSDPVEYYHYQHKLQVVAYRVVIQYNYHGTRTVMFPVGDYGLFINTQSQAHDQAAEFCEKIRARIRNHDKVR